MGYVIEIALKVKMNFEMLLKRHNMLGLISHTLLGRSGVFLSSRLRRQCRPGRISLRSLPPPPPHPQCLLLFALCWMLHCNGDHTWGLVHVWAADLSRSLPSLGRARLQGDSNLLPCQHALHCTQYLFVVCYKLCCLWEAARVCPVGVSCGPLVLAWHLCTAEFSPGSSVL